MTILPGNTHPVSRHGGGTVWTESLTGLSTSLLSGLLGRISDWIRRARLAGLLKLDDRQLADLGLTYSEVREALTQPAAEISVRKLDACRKARSAAGRQG